MNQFSSKQKQREKLLSQFISFTQANEKNAINFLSQHDWKLDLAVDAYYLSADSGGTRKESSKSSSTVDRKKLDQIWNLYKGTLSTTLVPLTTDLTDSCCCRCLPDRPVRDHGREDDLRGRL